MRNISSHCLSMESNVLDYEILDVLATCLLQNISFRLRITYATAATMSSPVHPFVVGFSCCWGYGLIVLRFLCMFGSVYDKLVTGFYTFITVLHQSHAQPQTMNSNDHQRCPHIIQIDRPTDRPPNPKNMAICSDAISVTPPFMISQSLSRGCCDRRTSRFSTLRPSSYYP